MKHHTFNFLSLHIEFGNNFQGKWYLIVGQRLDDE